MHADQAVHVIQALNRIAESLELICDAIIEQQSDEEDL